MTNANKYLKEGVDVRKLAEELYNYLTNIETEGAITETIEHFFGASCKPTLSEDEKVILRNINDMYVIIRRDDGGELYFDRSDGYCFNSVRIFNHLFQFIQPRRRI